jgi:hypothetical protein
MTKDEIIELARKNEALSDPEGIEYFFNQEELLALVDVAVKAEREACAGLAERRMLIDKSRAKRVGYDYACKEISADILARGN